MDTQYRLLDSLKDGGDKGQGGSAHAVAHKVEPAGINSDIVRDHFLERKAGCYHQVTCQRVHCSDPNSTDSFPNCCFFHSIKALEGGAGPMPDVCRRKWKPDDRYYEGRLDY